MTAIKDNHQWAGSNGRPSSPLSLLQVKRASLEVMTSHLHNCCVFTNGKWLMGEQARCLLAGVLIDNHNDSDWLFGASLKLKKRVWWEEVKDSPDLGGGGYVLAIVILSPLPLGRKSPALVNEVTWSSGVSLVNILHPEWVSTSTKIKKWALSSLSCAPLKSKDQPLSRALDL